MADEPKVNDPLADMVQAHMTRMAEIHKASFEKSKLLCDESLTAIRKKVGVREAVLDKVLENLGITQPGESSDGNSTTATVGGS